MVNRPSSASLTTRPGTVPGNRKALTRIEASTTALVGVEGASFADGGEDFGVLLRDRLAPGDADRLEQDFAALRQLRFQIVALFQPS